MSADSVNGLLELLIGHKGSHAVVLQLLKLPAAQQLSLGQIKSVLRQTSQFGDHTICEALYALPVAAAAVHDDFEVQIALATAAMVVVDLDPSYGRHRNQESCSCRGCRPEHYMQ
jgi:hypothetical protein